MFSGRRIRQARELRGLTQQELARRIGRSQAAVTHVERGFKDASADLVAAVAQHTQFPISFFSTEPPVEFPVQVLLFRARAAMRRREALAAARMAEITFEIGMNLAPYVTKIPLRLEKSAKPPVDAAQQTRRWMGLNPDDPIRHLVNTIERAGIVVMPIPTDQEDIDAFSAWIHETPVVALCTARNSGDRRRWSAAHELGHLVLHSGRPIRSDEHKQADEFAGELLLPEKAVRKEISAPVTLTSLAALKPRWGVSIQALVYRCHALGLITERQYRYLFEQIAVRGWRTREPANLDIPIEKPRALRKMAELSPFGADANRLAKELHLDTNQVQQILDSYEGPGAPSAHETRFRGKVIPLRAASE